MPAPYNRWRIIEHVRTTLLNLNCEWGIILRVEKRIVNIEEVGDEQLLTAFVVPAEVQPQMTRFPFGDIRKQLDLWVVVHAQASSTDDRQNAVDQIERNVRVAMELDQTRGGYAISTEMIEPETSDEAAPILPGGAHESATVALKFRIVYYPNDGGA